VKYLKKYKLFESKDGMSEMKEFLLDVVFEPELTIEQAIDTLDLNVTNKFDWQWISK